MFGSSLHWCLHMPAKKASISLSSGYGEIPKSCTMENRQNLIEHQLYATIQRKQPPVPPFTTDTPCARKGFTDSTVERFKRLNNGEMCPYVDQRGTKPENGILTSSNA